MRGANRLEAVHGRRRGRRARPAAAALLALGTLWAVAGGCGGNGARDDGDADLATVAAAPAALIASPVPGAVALLGPAGQPLCSGSLIAPRVALTAAHCVVREGITAWPEGLFAGADLRVGGVVLRVLGGETHPDYDAFLHRSDLAVLRLADSPPAAAPLALAAATPAAGAAVRLIGYGDGPAGPAGRQHTLAASVTAAGDGAVRFSPGGCPGDSGGPLLASATGAAASSDGGAPVEVIAGVASTGDLTCEQGRAADVAAHAAWISGAAQRLDPPDCRDGDQRCGAGCPFGDADCPCREDGRCELCDGLDPDCGDGCVADGFCSSGCLAPDPDCHEAADGDACLIDLECRSSLCLDGRCRSVCGGLGRGACAPWQTCVPAAGGRAACLDRPGAVTATGCSAGGGAAPSPAAAAAAPLLCLLIAGLAARARRLAPFASANRNRDRNHDTE